MIILYTLCLVIKIHLDTDIGSDIDDLCALVMLLKWSDVKITGITTVSDHQGKRAGMVRHVLQIAHRTEIPVASGADVSDGYYRYPPGIVDHAGYWPEPIIADYHHHNSALELLKRSIEEGSVIVGIGPLTNFALLERKYPGILQKAKLYIMGGFVLYPEIAHTPYFGDTDYNIQVDTGSAQFVLTHGNPVLVPLTTTVKTALTRRDLDQISQKDALNQLLGLQISQFDKEMHFAAQYGGVDEIPYDIINFHHDPLTAAIAAGFDQIDVREFPLVLETKESFLHQQIHPQGKPTKIVTSVQSRAFDQFWINMLAS